MNNRIIFFWLFFFLPIFLFAQSPELVKPPGRFKQNRLLEKARYDQDNGNFDRAVERYKNILKTDSANFDANFECGFVYYMDLKKNDSALKYMETALRNMPKEEVAEVYYYLALIYQRTNKFQEANYYYKLFSPFIRDGGYVLKQQVIQSVIDCRYALNVDERKDSLSVQNLGPSINTVNAEYIPVVNEADSILFFTARPRGDNPNEVEAFDDQFIEDIYFARKVEGEFAKPSSVSSDENLRRMKSTTGHEAMVGLTYDEKHLITYKADGLWISEIRNGVFQPSEKMPATINIGPTQKHASITEDGHTIYFSSDKEGGIGGLDIYKAERNTDGSWGHEINLGRGVNTPNDEDSPVITPDGTVLYFSSKGHLGYGGYDVFRRETDGKWENVVNLGFPINSAGDDIYFKPNKEGTLGYFASNREGGYGDMDIYRAVIDKIKFSNCYPMEEKLYPISLDGSIAKKKAKPGSIYLWDMGDGQEERGMNITHNYKRPGNYSVFLSIVDSTSGKVLHEEKEMPVIIDNVTHIEFIAPDTVDMNDNVLFIGTPTVVKDSRILSYSWNFGDEQKGDSIKPYHVYISPGVYEVKMDIEAINDANNKKSQYCVTKNIVVRTEEETIALRELEAAKAREIALRLEKEEETRLAIAKAKQKADSLNAVVKAQGENEEKTIDLGKGFLKQTSYGSGEIQFALENIYFDLNKANMRDDALEIMKKNVKILNEHPEAIIEISANTDSRGSKQYNQKLAEKRARTTVNYFVKAGIPKKRIAAVLSLGEDNLINKCGDDKECQEKEHQMNRRVEFKVY